MHKESENSSSWGKSPAENETPPVRRGRMPKNPVVQPYPYDSGFENLSSKAEPSLFSWTVHAYSLKASKSKEKYAINYLH